MTSKQPEKYAYCENENNQNFTFFQNSECFWIKFELCLEVTFLHTKTGITDFKSEYIPLVHTNKCLMIILFALNVSCQ